MNAWQGLPQPVKAGILAMVKAVSPDCMTNEARPQPEKPFVGTVVSLPVADKPQTQPAGRQATTRGL